jgi:hypothetical protein
MKRKEEFVWGGGGEDWRYSHAGIAAVSSRELDEQAAVVKSSVKNSKAIEWAG